MLCLKSLTQRAFGFAAGCEAVAMPRRTAAVFILGLRPWCGLWPNKSRGKARTRGRAR